jgi:hypothetical protein
LLLLAVVSACGPKSAPAVTNRTDATDFAAARTRLCDAARRLVALQCSPWNQVDRELLDSCTIVDSIYIISLDRCVEAKTCDSAHSCAEAVRREGGPYRGPTSPCQGGSNAEVPAGVTAAEVAASYGAKDRTFADSPSTKGQPIEVCGMPAQLDYLTRVTCADGSHPFANRDAAAEARIENVGAGGRCGRIVDHYAVPCPERTYDVFIEPYRCLAR